jgi:hypothetical protein
MYDCDERVVPHMLVTTHACRRTASVPRATVGSKAEGSRIYRTSLTCGLSHMSLHALWKSTLSGGRARFGALILLRIST